MKNQVEKQIKTVAARKYHCWPASPTRGIIKTHFMTVQSPEKVYLVIYCKHQPCCGRAGIGECSLRSWSWSSSSCSSSWSSFDLDLDIQKTAVSSLCSFAADKRLIKAPISTETNRAEPKQIDSIQYILGWLIPSLYNSSAPCSITKNIGQLTYTHTHSHTQSHRQLYFNAETQQET